MTIKERYRTGEKALTPDQAGALLAAVDVLLDEGLLKLAISGGLRREDIVNVKQADVHEDTGQIFYYERKKRRIYNCYLPENTMKTLSQIKRIYHSQWMFPAKDPRRHISSKTAYNLLQKYLHKIGVENRPFHALRSTCIKLCQYRGWSIEQTAKHVGDSIRVIQEHYLTPGQEEMKQVAEQKPLL